MGISQSELARRADVSQATIAGLFTGRQTGSKFIYRIAAELGTTPQYLMGEDVDARVTSKSVGSVTDAARHLNPAELGLIAIKEVDLSLGAGGEYLPEGAVMEVERWFPESWLREFTDAPAEKLVFARVRGDSMKPTIDNGAIVIIDMRRQRIDEQDVIWAIAIAEIGMVKRVWAQSDGSYKIKSDNPNVSAEIAVDGEMYVLGRVVGGLGKL